MWNIVEKLQHKIVGLLVGLASVFGLAGNNVSAPAVLPASATNTATTTQIVATSTPKTPVVKSTATSTATTTPNKTKTTAPKATTTPIVPKPVTSPTPVITPQPATSTPPIIGFEQINTKTREALVNILCITKSGGGVNPITGSGIIIDPRGVILTNAHIGQYYLIQNLYVPNFIDCTIRTGSPASPAYKAELLYISSRWINRNAENIVSESPLGTGEDDFALLIINRRTDTSKPFPTTFPYVQVDSREKNYTGQDTLVAGYAAGFLGGLYVTQDLYSTSAIAKVKEEFSFSGDTYDLLALSGTVVAQKGSSGGAVVTAENKLIGLISTVSLDKTTDARMLGAITTAHISRSMFKQSGTDLMSFLTGDIHKKAAQFQEIVAPGLAQKLIDVIVK